MKTYILQATTSFGFEFIATEAKNKKEAYLKVKEAMPEQRIHKTSVMVSAVNIAYTGFKTV